VSADTLNRFSERVLGTWLSAYCADSRRRYDTRNFVNASIAVYASDAADCMEAIDRNIVSHVGGGRFRAKRSSAQEVLFWDGTRRVVPRKIWLWLEPVITFAALARLHLRHGWPVAKLGTQPPGWAFDVVAYAHEEGDEMAVLAEVKKSRKELDSLHQDLLALTDGAAETSVKPNSLKKWKAIVKFRPQVVWLLGPNEYQYVLVPKYGKDATTLHDSNVARLNCRAA
jgi:hypothetical protein